MQTAHIKAKSRREDGSFDTILTMPAVVKEVILPWQAMGLHYTATGYGSKIPTRYMVKYNNKWRRVYCRVYSNSGTLYIGKLSDNIFVDIDYE